MTPVTIEVSREGDEPVYVQIARQIRERIAAGDLEPGAALPPVRTLAVDLGVNLNTVARAYRSLEEEGFVTIRERSGAAVAPPGSRAGAEGRRRLGAELRGLLARMRQAGLGGDQMKDLVERELAALGTIPGRPGKGGAR